MIQERRFKIHIDHLDPYFKVHITFQNFNSSCMVYHVKQPRFAIMVFASFRYTATLKVALLLQTH